jgi:hypothetical protein
MGLASMTYAYNPNYSGDRDQEDESSKPALSQKYPTQKKGLVERLKS